jgi:hypothetical protein
MKKEQQLHSSFLSARWLELGRRPIYVFGYSKTGKFVCRLEINAAGIAVYTGTKRRKKLCDKSWEGLVKNLAEK